MGTHESHMYGPNKAGRCCWTLGEIILFVGCMKLVRPIYFCATRIRLGRTGAFLSAACSVTHTVPNVRILELLSG